MPADFATCFDFTPRRYRPMKKPIESRDAHTTGRWFDVFQEGREAADDLAGI